ncbi:hypothetical protein FWJ25_02370 [Marinobacter salinexigens]|uniref:Uncharacterized protein n=1 Tax=Marinobacter salinexigens TaxID=2919747 RepID=A0A5B0VN08_9GAMM|nr:hypothetical protein FWJ25_02370 [Marinobacter salinexigens]
MDTYDKPSGGSFNLSLVHARKDRQPVCVLGSLKYVMGCVFLFLVGAGTYGGTLWKRLLKLAALRQTTISREYPHTFRSGIRENAGFEMGKQQAKLLARSRLVWVVGLFKSLFV